MVRSLIFVLILGALFSDKVFASQAVVQLPGGTQFIVKEFVVTQLGQTARVFESPRRFEMVGNSINVRATISAQIGDPETWRLGVIQQIDFMDIRETYSSLVYSWRLPRLPYCDSSPASAREGQAWFSQPITLTGPASPKTCVLEARDNPGLGCPWNAVSSFKSALKKPNKLQDVFKEYRFTDWLAAERLSDHKLVLLLRFKWHFLAHARLDPGQPIGRRAHVVSHEIEKPVVDLPLESDLDSLTRAGVISGKECGNRDQRLFVETKVN